MQAGDPLLLEPGVEAPAGGVVVASPGKVAEDRSGSLDSFGFEPHRESPPVETQVRDAVVPDHGLREDEDLPVVGRIGEGFGVPDHSRVEDDFPLRAGLAPELRAGISGPILEEEVSIGH